MLESRDHQPHKIHSIKDSLELLHIVWGWEERRDSCGMNMIGDTPEDEVKGGSAHAHGKGVVFPITITHT
ncbi:hypothetical protein [Halobacillus mangrovi]|uniref:hypothetical protein n=1 Tax=Halobacillus mangrovi TaxID=402384 RepID=UPI003D984022